MDKNIEANEPCSEETCVSVDNLILHPCVAKDLSSRDDFEELCHSVSKIGLTRPLLVCNNDGELLVIDGEKRLEAVRAANLMSVRAFVLYDVTADEAVDLRNLGNAFVRDMSPSKRAALAGRARVRVDSIVSRNPALYTARRPPILRILTEIVYKSRSLVFLYSSIDSDMTDEFKSLLDAGLLTDRSSQLVLHIPKEVQRALFANFEHNGITKKADIERALRILRDPNEALNDAERTLREASEMVRMSGMGLSAANIEALQGIIHTAAETLGLANSQGN